MIHAMGAMHAALRAKSKLKQTQTGSPAQEVAKSPKTGPSEKPERSKD